MVAGEDVTGDGGVEVVLVIGEGGDEPEVLCARDGCGAGFFGRSEDSEDSKESDENW